MKFILPTFCYYVRVNASKFFVTFYARLDIKLECKKVTKNTRAHKIQEFKNYHWIKLGQSIFL